jgi:predicted O-methyltransferase YrrM
VRSLSGAVRRNRALLRLPPRVALFYSRARRLAMRTGDQWSLDSATKPESLAFLLHLAKGRRRTVEIGTGTAWTTIALALADGERRVLSFDPVVRPERDRHLALAAAARPRIELVEAPGEHGLGDRPGPVDLVFVDGSHERELTIATFEAWREVLAPGGAIAFHDFGNPEYPGVTEAIRELALEGEVHRDLFVWSR